ncbi:hypothetical protein L873DRAFT_1799533 [Choiromyces venosus 120613-1]|uniref:Uncharacterized protein n=1 Tax=Choiromyces venosus 120613-1 TaxID=1336337 RepID=A0A3N4K0J1_9PEZI|nr:hypothetical protein L873DRAFT_1799533 [Choiromyces venosus 120613-1]
MVMFLSTMSYLFTGNKLESISFTILGKRDYVFSVVTSDLHSYPLKFIPIFLPTPKYLIITKPDNHSISVSTANFIFARTFVFLSFITFRDYLTCWEEAGEFG